MIPISLDVAIPFDTIEEEETETSKTYRIDWDAGRILGFVDEVEAMKQFIRKALITPRFKCLIYDSQYGSEIRSSVMENDVTREYIETEMPFLVEDALIHDERVLQVYNLDFEFKDTYPLQDSVVITFDVDTIFGEVSIEEVV